MSLVKEKYFSSFLSLCGSQSFSCALKTKEKMFRKLKKVKTKVYMNQKSHHRLLPNASDKNWSWSLADARGTSCGRSSLPGQQNGVTILSFIQPTNIKAKSVYSFSPVEEVSIFPCSQKVFLFPTCSLVLALAGGGVFYIGENLFLVPLPSSLRHTSFTILCNATTQWVSVFERNC